MRAGALLSVVAMVACAQEADPMLEALAHLDGIVLEETVASSAEAGEWWGASKLALALAEAGRAEEASLVALAGFVALPRGGVQGLEVTVSQTTFYAGRIDETALRRLMRPEELEEAERLAIGLSVESFVVEDPDGCLEDPELSPCFAMRLEEALHDYVGLFKAQVAWRWIAIGEVGRGWALADHMAVAGCSPHTQAQVRARLRHYIACARPGWRQVGDAAVAAYLANGEDQRAWQVAREMDARGLWEEGDGSVLTIGMALLDVGREEDALRLITTAPPNERFLLASVAGPGADDAGRLRDEELRALLKDNRSSLHWRGWFDLAALEDSGLEAAVNLVSTIVPGTNLAGIMQGELLAAAHHLLGVAGEEHSAERAGRALGELVAAFEISLTLATGPGDPAWLPDSLINQVAEEYLSRGLPANALQAARLARQPDPAVVASAEAALVEAERGLRVDPE